MGTDGAHGTQAAPQTHRHAALRRLLHTDAERDARGHVLLFVAGLAGLAAAVLPVGGRDGVDGGALFAGGMGGVRGVGQARPGLARVVVELHEAEDQVGGHELELVRRVCDHVPAEQTRENDTGGGGGGGREGQITGGETPTLGGAVLAI